MIAIAMDSSGTESREAQRPDGCSAELAEPAFLTADLLSTVVQVLELLHYALERNVAWTGGHSARSLRRVLRAQSEELRRLSAVLVDLERCGESCRHLRMLPFEGAERLPVRDRTLLAHTVPALAQARWRVGECVAELRHATYSIEGHSLRPKGLPHWLGRLDHHNSLHSIRMGVRSVGSSLLDLGVIARSCVEESRWTAISLRMRS